MVYIADVSWAVYGEAPTRTITQPRIPSPFTPDVLPNELRPVELSFSGIEVAWKALGQLQGEFPCTKLTSLEPEQPSLEGLTATFRGTLLHLADQLAITLLRWKTANYDDHSPYDHVFMHMSTAKGVVFNKTLLAIHGLNGQQPGELAEPIFDLWQAIRDAHTCGGVVNGRTTEEIWKSMEIEAFVRNHITNWCRLASTTPSQDGQKRPNILITREPVLLEPSLLLMLSFPELGVNLHMNVRPDLYTRVKSGKSYLGYICDLKTRIPNQLTPPLAVQTLLSMFLAGALVPLCPALQDQNRRPERLQVFAQSIPGYPSRVFYRSPQVENTQFKVEEVTLCDELERVQALYWLQRLVAEAAIRGEELKAIMEQYWKPYRELTPALPRKGKFTRVESEHLGNSRRITPLAENSSLFP